MIKELIIKNFEAHDLFRAKLDPHITTFTGATDKGKSSIIRAIQWVVLNRPLGDSFIRDESKPTFVGIKTEKGKVVRKKGKGINCYILNRKKLEAFGTNVPEEVQQFLNMEKLNFQSQFDAPYWFMVSPGEVSKQLNQIVDLEIIDTSFSKMSSKVRQGETEKSLSQKRLNEVKTTLSRIGFMKPMMKQYTRLEKLETQKEERHAYFNSMRISIKDVKRYVLRAKMLRKANSAGQCALEIGIKYENKTREVESLSDLVKSLEYNMTIVKSEIPNIQQLISITNKWKKLKKFCISLSKCITEIIMEKEKVCQRKKELIIKEEKLKQMIGKTCPLCGSRVTK